jgi:predicted phage-related endonuclease
MVGKVTDGRHASCSVLPAIMGVSPWSTKNDALNKCLMARDGAPDDWQGNEATEWGNRLEPVVMQEMADRLGLDGWYEPDHGFKHPTLPLAASLDGIGHASGQVIKHDPSKGIFVVGAETVTLNSDIVMESKITRSDPEPMPAPFRGPVQVQGGMMCTGLSYAAIGVLYGGVELRIFVYPSNPKLMTQIADAVMDFERRLEDREYYPAESSADCDVIWPIVDDSEPAIDLPASIEDVDILELVEAHHAATRAKKACDETKDDVEKVLKELLGNHEAGRIGDYEVKWPMRHYKAQPEKTTPAKPAYSKRQSVLSIRKVS